MTDDVEVQGDSEKEDATEESSEGEGGKPTKGGQGTMVARGPLCRSNKQSLSPG